MALGQVTAGHPIYGVWLSTALAVAATLWSLYAFVPPRRALLGGILMATHPQILEWGQRDWGGNVAVLGGSLLLGAAASPTSPIISSWLSLGIFLLSITRPYEGLILTLLVIPAAYLLRRTSSSPGTRERAGVRVHVTRNTQHATHN